MDLGLSGKRFLVTGGTRGIGRAVVEGLLAEGAAVAYCARTPDAVAETQSALTADGAIAIGSVVDVGDAAALTDWVNSSFTALGGIDGVVANVSALAIPESIENWHTSFDVDLMGAVGLVEAALPHLLASGAGSIVTISSVSGREIDFAAGPYGTMKAAIIHYTQGLAFKLAGQGVRANTVSPGNTYFPGGVWSTIEQNDPELFATALGLNPTGRMAEPREIANAVVFLSSSAASFITGTNLLVDGALTRGVQFWGAHVEYAYVAGSAAQIADQFEVGNEGTPTVTLLTVRSFMTPSIAALLGRWFWWPVRVRQRPIPRKFGDEDTRQLSLL